MARKTVTSDEVKNRYGKKTYDRVVVTLRKEHNKKEKYKQLADEENLSLTQFVVKAVEEYIEKGKC